MGMRVLVTSPAGLGHVHPMVPLARSLAGRGHDVLWAVPGLGVPEVERTGMRAVATAPAARRGPAEALQLFPELAALPREEMPERMFGKLFGAMHAPAMLEGMLPVAGEFRPDLVVSDAAELAGHIVAAELGIPSVSKGFGPMLPARRVERAAEEVAPLWRSRGLEPRAYAGSYDTLYIDHYPPSLQQSEPYITRRTFLRPGDESGEVPSASAPPLPEGPADAPLVYLTMGTVFNDPTPLQVCIDALASMRLRALVTVGPTVDPAVFGAQPEHVRVERYVPQNALLHRCDLVISHAGSGTTLGAAAHGLPQLFVPQGADQFLNARAFTARGAALTLMPSEHTTSAVVEAVARLLEDTSFHDAAAHVRAEMEAMPHVDEVAALLETVA